jgi:hypothetical protein
VPNPFRTITGALAAILAVIVGWSLWTMRDADPVVSPLPVRQAEKPAEAPSTALVTDTPVSRAEITGSGGPVVEEVAGDPQAQTHPDGSMTGVPAPFAAGDFPPYLGAVANAGPSSLDARGCKSPSRLLADMSQESRDELWAPRVERELRAMLGQHPFGFQVSVGCRATICQITEIGAITEIDPADDDEWRRHWGSFMRNFLNSPLASEFATSRFFAGRYSSDVTPEPGEIPSGYWDIAGFVLTSAGQATPSEPPDCSLFQSPEEF